MHAQYFALIYLNLKLHIWAKASFSLPLILLGITQIPPGQGLTLLQLISRHLQTGWGGEA